LVRELGYEVALEAAEGGLVPVGERPGKVHVLDVEGGQLSLRIVGRIQLLLKNRAEFRGIQPHAGSHALGGFHSTRHAHRSLILLGRRGECKPSGVSDVGPCVDDEALLALARGELSGPALAKAEAHLRDCADCRAVLAAGAVPDEGAGPARIARYEIAALLGAGASGVVYRAFDPQLKRAVALKLLRPELHAEVPVQSERLLREAQAMARLSDPHVVAVYDVGMHQGSVYLVMEFIDGATLGAWLEAHERSLAEILGVFGDAALGLAAAHQSGLVHRDFKPENVLVTRDGRAKVTDFGLARESEPRRRDEGYGDVASTELYAPTRGLIGTPAYMAPELFEGGRATPKSDQFAFGVALFAALFGRHPFRAGEGIAFSELVTRVRASAPEAPTFESPAHQRLFEVLRRSLAATPEARFPDMAALMAALGSARRRRGTTRWLLAAAAAALPLTALAWPRPSVSPARRAVPSSSVVAAAAAPESAASLPSPLPSATAPSSVKKPSFVAPSGKRRTAKSAEVRYKDWLKDPF
jgi:eukaryotic-like serine/threonine-protein kinase